MRNYHQYSNKLRIPSGCPAIEWKNDKENGDGNFDEEIVPLLIKLNTDKWHTVASCAGHSEEEVADLLIGYGVGIPFRISIHIHVHIEALEEFKEMVNEMSEVTSGFWCELGYVGDELSNLTEKDYLPFYIQIFCNTKENRDETLKVLESIAAFSHFN